MYCECILQRLNILFYPISLHTSTCFLHKIISSRTSNFASTNIHTSSFHFTREKYSNMEIFHKQSFSFFQISNWYKIKFEKRSFSNDRSPPFSSQPGERWSSRGQVHKDVEKADPRGNSAPCNHVCKWRVYTSAWSNA